MDFHIVDAGAGQSPSIWTEGEGRYLAHVSAQRRNGFALGRPVKHANFIVIAGRQPASVRAEHQGKHPTGATHRGEGFAGDGIPYLDLERLVVGLVIAGAGGQVTAVRAESKAEDGQTMAPADE